MRTRFLLTLIFLSALSCRAQVSPAVIGGGTEMVVPPPVSGDSYTSAFSAEERSNYLSAGISVNGAYIDNVQAGGNTTPTSDESFMILPSIAIDQTKSQFHHRLLYSPGFTFYAHTSDLNQSNQNLTYNMRYRWTPHITVSFVDFFRRNSDAFSQPIAASGSPTAPISAVVAPTAVQLNNLSHGEITYQYAPNSMVGAAGDFSYLHYPKPSQAVGLSDYNSKSGSAFYSRRLNATQYTGVSYQYSDTSSTLSAIPGNIPGVSQTAQNSETTTHAFLPFYTIYLGQGTSMSLLAGVQRYQVSETATPTVSSWSPIISASAGWQGGRTSFALSYARFVTGGGGLVGAYNSDSATGFARWQVARRWITNVSSNYVITSNVSGSQLGANPGGHMLTVIASVQHQIGTNFSVTADYTRLHQSYGTVAAAAISPDANRESVTFSYIFSRPLGR